MTIALFAVLVIGFGLANWLEVITNNRRNQEINQYLEGE